MSFEGSLRSWRVSKYRLLAVLYFFFNSLFLPKGLLFTTVMAPYFYLRQLMAGRKTYAGFFFTVLLLFDAVHLCNGVELKSFAVSNILFVLVYFFTVSLWHFVRLYKGLPIIFRDTLLLNAVMVIIALIMLAGPSEYWGILWYVSKVTAGFDNFPRLSLITYEASYYSLLFVPVFLYYISKFLTGGLSTNRWAWLLLAVIPLLLSFSFGVIGALFISAFVIVCMNAHVLLRKRKTLVILLSVTLMLGAGIFTLYRLDPANVLFVRLDNIFSGKDTSARGRTTESFGIAWKIAANENIFFGAGLGQIKVVIADIVKREYNYWGVLPRYDIPNAAGETLAIFGLLGLALRLFIQIWLFRRLRVWRNLYSLALFIFIFVYQFTGSFITNTVEYAIWVLAYARPFPQFDFKELRKDDVQRG